jgi:hypothetical protein
VAEFQTKIVLNFNYRGSIFPVTRGVGTGGHPMPKTTNSARKVESLLAGPGRAVLSIVG